MKLQHLVIAAAIGIAVAGCSAGDGEPLSAPPTLPSTTQAPVTSAPTVTEAPTTTRAPAPTTQAPLSSSNQIPSTLAFASNDDVGRLFEIDGETTLFSIPINGEETPIADGVLVRAAIAQGISGEVWVGLVPPEDPSSVLGWVRAEDLRSTLQSVTTTNLDATNELRIAQVSQIREIEISREPGSTSIVAALTSREIAIHGGSTTITPDGVTWRDVVDVDGQRIGWTDAPEFIPVSSHLARSQSDSSEADRRPDPAVTYGAALPQPTVTFAGCNATQISLANTSSSGLAVIFGELPPVGFQRGDTEQWTAQGGAQLFAGPGETIVLTVHADRDRTWFFGRLDNELRAEADRDGSGNLIGGPGALVTAIGLSEVPVPAGSCVAANVVRDPNDFYSFDRDGNFIGPDPDDPEPELELEDDEGLDQEALDEIEQELNEQLNEPVDTQNTEDGAPEDEPAEDQFDQQ